MKKRLLALLISAMTLFSGFAVQAADTNPADTEEVIIETESQTYDANVALPSRNYTGIVPGYDGNFYLYNNGRFASTYNGLYGDAVYGWWLITNGVVNLGYTDLYGDAALGWWKIANGTVDFGYTGLYTSPTLGTWYIVGGCVDLARGPQNATAAYNDGYSDNTYGFYKGTVSNDTEAMNLIINALLAHSVRIEATTVGGYTGRQFMNCFSALHNSWEYEAPAYDIACYSTYFGSYGGNYCNITIEYWEGIAEEQYMDQLAASMKASTAGMSEYDKIVYIHDYLCRVCNYDYTYSNYSPYSCVALGKTVCQGYAMAFMKLAEACGLKVMYLASNDHAYNAVYLNGNWYMVDVTWDDGVGSKRYFLKGLNGLYNVGYNYANWFNCGIYSINIAPNDYR
ncbi:MAG: hypothetical protein MJ105_02545 [Lachnospiraceae bacterium]|nr:hypothetical protein [Lachnospiraceae bacterium]